MKKEIEIKPKKPKLAYIGMDERTIAEAVPTQVIEIVYPQKAEVLKQEEQKKLFETGQLGTGKITKAMGFPKNRLIWTNDNLVALRTLLDEKDPISGEYKYRNKIDLIYIDPPFMIQDDFIAQNSIDIEVNEKEGVVSVKEPTIIETIAYKDTWQNGLDSFLQMMRERLELMKELLSPTGSIYVHLDWHAAHYVKVLMDEIFDYSNFVNHIIWTYGGKGLTGTKGSYVKYHADILLYSKTNNPYIQARTEGITESVRGRFGKYINENNQILFKTLKENNELSELRKATKRFIRENGKDPSDEDVAVDFNKGSLIKDIWDDIPIIRESFAYEEFTGYPTQKPVELMIRIIKSSCPINGILLDAFVGSGTTCEAAEQLANELNCIWIGIDNSKFGIHTARKRLIELNGKPKPEKNAGVYKVRPFTVENMGYYQRGAKWDSIQVSNQADAYRQAIIELFGGEYVPYSKLLHGKKKGAWVHVGPLSKPIVSEQVMAIAKEVKDTDFKKCYVLSADFTAHLNKVVEEAKEKFGVQVTTRIIPASAIDEVKKRLGLIKQGIRNSEKVSEMPNLTFFAPLAVKIHKVVDGKEAMIELSGLEVDAESFLESQKPERRDELKKWLAKEKSWQSFVDFWAIDWDYENLKDNLGEPVFENEWQSFRKRKGKKIVEDLVFKAFHTYEKKGEYTIAVKVTDIFGNDGIVTAKVVIK